jgi:hypothetical protein
MQVATLRCPERRAPSNWLGRGFSVYGRNSLAIAEAAGLNVLLANGDGTFRTVVEYPTTLPTSVAVAILVGYASIFSGLNGEPQSKGINPAPNQGCLLPSRAPRNTVYDCNSSFLTQTNSHCKIESLSR